MKSITDINGVYVNGIHCGIKAKKKDLAFVFVPKAVATAAVFTRNQFAAPCIEYSRKMMKGKTVKAVIVNSGNANAGTGESGYMDAREMAKLAAPKLGLHPNEIAVASTGVIGVPLPMDTISAGIETLLKDPHVTDSEAAAEAILTTDLCTKHTYKSQKIGKKEIKVAGFAKGSGMIAPNMGTMLAYLATNVDLSQERLQGFFQNAVNDSFNMVSVDNDTSTNDMAMIFATGERKFSLSNKDEVAAFQALLTSACQDLAKQMAKDGEGATRTIEVHVTGARNHADAKIVAMNVVNSPLVKTAVHGADPNWGRVLAAAGKDPNIKFNAAKVSLSFNGVDIVKDGVILGVSRADIASKIAVDEIYIHVDLGLAGGEALAWGCDLTKGYIDINTAYS